ncbi:MAG: hypothetical protein QXO40_04555, partial [Candidatus Aenigmatarchaeota archaeon]
MSNSNKEILDFKNLVIRKNPGKNNNDTIEEKSLISVMFAYILNKEKRMAIDNFIDRYLLGRKLFFS